MRVLYSGQYFRLIKYNQHSRGQISSITDSLPYQIDYVDEYRNLTGNEVYIDRDGRAWFDWPDLLRDREVETLEAFKSQHQQALTSKCFEQFQFFEQWQLSGIRKVKMATE